jgi:hypothetical protein
LIEVDRNKELLVMTRASVLAALLCTVAHPAFAQQDDLATLKAELVKQQEVVAQLLKRVEELEARQSTTTAAVERQEQAHEDEIASVRDTQASRVNISGYYNFRFFSDSSDEPRAFQQHHLGLILGKQLGRFSFFSEIELQNIPHHAELIAPGAAPPASDEAMASDVSGEGQVAVENAWMEYSHNKLLNVRVGKQLSPQFWWQNHYPNLTYSTDQPIYLRELFPPELVGAMLHGAIGGGEGSDTLGVNYRFYVANNTFEGNSRADLSGSKSYGGRVQLQFPVSGTLRRLNVAADVYRGHIALSNDELVTDKLFGLEGQVETARLTLRTEYARGWSLGAARFGYYVEPAVRLSDDWIAFYRIEGLESPRIWRAERRHLAGLNYRPFPQIALKAEYYRSIPVERSFIPAGRHREPFDGIAAAAVFFF